MPANTSPDNIEYPVSTDPVAPLETVFANMANSVQDAFDGFRVDWNGFEGNHAIQTFRWADATARAAQTGMAVGDIGLQLDTGVQYRYNGASWTVWNDPTWRTATLGSSWTAEVGNVPQYRLVSGLLVWRGRAQTTGTLTTFTTLPVGYRPDVSASGTSRFLVAGDSTTPGVIAITSAGVVTLSSGSTSIYYAIGSLPALSVGV